MRASRAASAATTRASPSQRKGEGAEPGEQVGDLALPASHSARAATSAASAPSRVAWQERPRQGNRTGTPDSDTVTGCGSQKVSAP